METLEGMNFQKTFTLPAIHVQRYILRWDKTRRNFALECANGILQTIGDWS